MEIDDAINSYVFYLDSENKSKNTIRNAKYTIEKFCKALNIKEAKDLQLEAIDRYKIQLKEKEVSGVAVRQYTCRIKVFIDFLYQRGYIENDLGNMITLLSPKKAILQRGKLQYKDKPGRIFDKKEFEFVINTANKMYKMKQYGLMIELLLVSGFRINELFNIKLKNINFQTGNVKITSKFDKTREFYLASFELLEKIELHCEKNNINDLEQLIFPSKNGNPISYQNFTRILRRIFSQCAIPYGKEKGGFTTHDFRRTCATLLSDVGLSIIEIQDILGHGDIRITRHYIKQHDIPEAKKIKLREHYNEAFYSDKKE